MIITSNNSLVRLYPKIVQAWNYDRNIGLDPKSFSYGSEKIVWWKCSKCGFEWQCPIYYRTIRNTHNCKRCNCLAIKNPELLCEIHPSKNKNFDPLLAHWQSALKIWWKCKICGHEWQVPVYNRTNPHRKTGCMKCKRKKTNCKNSLHYLNKKLSRDWNFDKNYGLTPKDFTANSHKIVNWKCKKCGYEWRESPNSYATRSGGCLNCRSLAVKKTNLTLEWNYEKNGKLTPFDLSAHSNIKVWWKCVRCKNEWQASPNQRERSGCPNRHKIILKNGAKCASLIEAYIYLQLKNKKVVFKHNGYYGGSFGKKRYDFYLPCSRTYIEVTSFNKKSVRKSWFSYLRNIVAKKKYIKNVLCAKFRFINKSLSKKQIAFVRENSKMVYHQEFRSL